MLNLAVPVRNALVETCLRKPANSETWNIRRTDIEKHP
jgi:hypothetical protein